MAGSYQKLTWDDKDPVEIINEAVDFGSSLDTGDSLATVAYVLEAGDTSGVVMTNVRIDGTLARVTLSGGTAGTKMSAICTVTTTGGEKLVQAVVMAIKVKQ